MDAIARAAGTNLRGRANECATLDELIADVRRSESRTIVVRGEAGIGRRRSCATRRARVRALLSDGSEAEPPYREAIERLGRTRMRPQHARALLVYGEWLRREGRRAEVQEQLRAAHGLFSEMRIDGFAERTRGELQPTDEIVRRPETDAHDDLTRKEAQIARVARDGLSKPEIGSHLFLSPRTVEWHLHKGVHKLAIRSRRELATAMPGA